MAAMEVVVVDKAVSTEDLGLVTRDIHLEVARLEAMLNTLVENKVESMKADKEKDKEKVSKQRITSTSTASSSQHGAPGRKHRHHHHTGKHHTHKHDSSPSRSRIRGRTKPPTCCDHERTMSASAMAVIPACVSEGEEDDELMDEAYDFLTYQEQHDHAASCPCACPCPCACTCACPTAQQDNQHGQIMKLPYDDDFVSITMDVDVDVVDDLGMLSEEEMLRRARRRRRRKRRKRRRRQRLAAAAAVTAAAAARRDARKALDADDLPQRARWTIVATACLLLLMCLLLVGVTLRMAPIIDDMVRKENEELMNSLNRESSGWNTTSTTPAPAVAAVGAGP